MAAIGNSTLSTGLPGLDKVLKGLMPGDNVVLQVGDIEDYRQLVDPYVRSALKAGKSLTYFRFARHEPLLTEDSGANIHEISPEAGFENFLSEIHRVIETRGVGAFYVFDCLSDLAADWYSDRMLGNFFMLTCPYLFDLETITYFALLRNHHSAHAFDPILETTQILFDVYRHHGRTYVHPVKVDQRYSPTMYMLHVWEENEFRPVTQSAETSEILTSVQRSPFETARYQLDVWNRTFLRASELIEARKTGRVDEEEVGEVTERLLRMAVSREGRVLELARKYLSLEDLLDVGQRMVGTGLIGGKAVGMLLARAILKKADPRWKNRLEVHDSFYVASDVFYTYLVRNGCWWVRQKQRDPENYLEGAERARQSILRGSFPENIVQAFSNMLDYFGQSPIIVRSSSLLEDNFGDSFSGKYESFFCPNQGSRDLRLQNFLAAIRRIYACTMSEKALVYRARRGLLERDEQMSILVQRVSGDLHGDWFFPQIAGVGFSFNPYAWSEEIDSRAGMLRLVFGLGTRAVDRADDDYTRIVALNAPQLRLEADPQEKRRFSQHKVDALDLQANQHISTEWSEMLKRSGRLPVDLFASRDPDIERYIRETGKREVSPYVLTFDRLLKETEFVKDMREMLATLEEAYGAPVDVEFTASFNAEDDYRISLVQCRPFQVQSEGAVTEIPENLPEKDLILRARGAIIGPSRLTRIDRLILVVPEVYGNIPIRDRYSIARLIGRATHLAGEGKSTLLIGPGRWGTSTPSLGVPVSFSEIGSVSVLCEVVAMRKDLVPDVSLGTHFFNDLVETNILYMALFPDREGNELNNPLLQSLPNRLTDLIPEAEQWTETVRILEARDFPGRRAVMLNANTVRQEVVCYLEG